MKTLNFLQPATAIFNPIKNYVQPCPDSHQRVIQHYQERIVVESLPKTRLFRPTEAPAKPPFLSAVLQLLLRHGFDEKTIRVGITGFGNVKTHLAEIGLVSTKRQINHNKRHLLNGRGRRFPSACRQQLPIRILHFPRRQRRRH